MASEDKELAQQLRKAGDELSKFPTPVDQLLPLLDNVENLLSKVEQSPSETLQNAYSQSMKALLAEPLLRHTNADVKVAVASCISEITRITAPEAPYNDDQMKEVFQLIVSSFADLSDQSSRSYNKRASILETVAKVRSCVVMLDLECDGLISEMFQHFLSSIRDHHPEHIFTSMETIMTLVLEESEDISLELLAPMLASLKMGNEEYSPIARKLGESVFDKCAVKVKPYLKQAVKTLDLSLDAYSNIVSTICNGTNGEVDHKQDYVSLEKSAEGSKLTKTTSNEIVQDEREHVAKEARVEEVPPEVEKSVKPITNGMPETGDKDISNVCDSPKKPDDGNLNTLNVDVNNKQDTADVDTEKSVKVESKQEKTAKRRGKKPSSKANITKPLGSSGIDGDKETETTSQKITGKEADILPDVDKDDGKDAHISVSEDSHVDPRASPQKEKEVTPPISPTKPFESEGNVASLSPSKSLPDDESLPKNLEVSKKKDLAEEDASSLNLVAKTKNAETSGMEIKSERPPEKKKQNSAQGDAPSVDSSDTEVKPQKRSGKKKENVARDHEPSLDPHSVDVAGAEGSSDSEIKSQKLSRKKKGNVGQEDEPSVNPVSAKVADGSCDSEVEGQMHSGKKEENLAQEDVQSVDPPSPKVYDEISDSEDKPRKRTGKKAAGRLATGGRSRTKKGRKILGGKGKSKTEIEDDGDTEKKQPTHSVKKGAEESDSDTKPLVQSGNKEITSKPRVQSLKKSGKKGTASGTKVSSKKEETSNEDQDLSEKDDGKKSADVKNAKEKLLPKSHAKDDDQDMITSPISVKDEDSKLNSKRKRTPGKNKVSGDLEYGDNLVGAKVKVWWPEDEEFYEGVIESYNDSNKKHKVSYTDGDEEMLILRKEKWEFVDDGTTQEAANKDLNPNSSAKSHSRKKAKTNPEPKSKQKQMDVSSPRSGRAVGSSKSKGASTKSGGKIDNKSKDKTSKPTAKSEDSSESDDDVPIAASKSRSTKSGGKIDSKSKDKTPEPTGKSDDTSESDDDVPIAASKSKAEAKSKLETPKTVTKSKGKAPQSGSTSTIAGKLKSSSSKGKDLGNTKGKSSDSGKTPEAAGKGKSPDIPKAGKSGKKRRRGSRA